MRSHFFITGLPRTRTAWLANFFTGPHSFCLHDGLRECARVADLRRCFAEVLRDYPVQEHPHIAGGNSDSALLLLAQDVCEEFPGSRWLHITRPVGEARVSYEGTFSRVPAYRNEAPPTHAELIERFQALAECSRSLPDLIPEEQYFSLPFAKLGDRATMLLAWQWLLPGRPFPEYRWRMLTELNVQLRPGVREANMANLHTLFAPKQEEPVWH